MNWATGVLLALIAISAPPSGDGESTRATLAGSCEIAEDCDDGVDCTMDSCTNGQCSHDADHLFCSDGLACNGPEYCGAGGCEGHFGPLCGAGQYCDEDVDACLSVSDCCRPHGSAGCDDAACASMVCALSPECCTAHWDLACAAAATTQCGSICNSIPVGVEIVETTSVAAAAAGLVMYNIYVQLNSAKAEVLGVGSALISTDDPQGFFQDPFGTDLPPNYVFCTVFPMLCVDSFVTIGTASPHASLATDPDFDSAAFNPPAPQNVVAGGWFNSGYNQNDLGLADENLQVLLAQLSVRVGYGIFGQMYVIMDNGGLLYLQSFDNTGCLSDMDGDGVTGASDLAVLLGAWGPNPGHPADLNDDAVVDAADLALLLGSWGSCTE